MIELTLSDEDWYLCLRLYGHAAELRRSIGGGLKLAPIVSQ